MSLRLLARGVLDPELGHELAETRPAVAARLADVGAVARTVDRVAADRAGRLPDAVLAGLFEAGLFTLTVPAELGGGAATLLEFCRATAMVAEQDAALAVISVPHLANGVLSVALFGTSAQREEVLGGIARHRTLIAFALTEAHTGSDVASHRATLSRAAGALRLDGSKTWITNVPMAGHVVVVARCPGLSPIKDGSAFVLVRPGDPGFTTGHGWNKLAVNASPTVDLYFDAVPLAEERVVGRMGRAMDQFGEVVIWGRLGAAAGGCGLLARVADWAARTAAAHPAAARLARALARREVMARACLEITAISCGSGRGDRETAAALCKIYCTRTAEQAARAAWAFAVEHLRAAPPWLGQTLLEAALFKVLEGPNELLGHRAAIALLAGRRAPPPQAAPDAAAASPTPIALGLGDPAPRPRVDPAVAPAAALARAFSAWIGPIAASAPTLAEAPVQDVVDLACAAWASACGAAWAAHPAISAEQRDRARDAGESYAAAALSALRSRTAEGGLRPGGG